MTPVEKSALTEVAKRVVWFKAPDEALADEGHFIAHVLAHGSLSDVQTLRRIVGDERIATRLKEAPPGILSARQWTFWNLKFNGEPVPPVPLRHGRSIQSGLWDEALP